MARADIVLEKNSTRVVNTLDVATGQNLDPSVHVDPTSQGSIELRDKTTNPTETGVLEADYFGGVSVRDEKGDDTGQIELEPGSSLRLNNPDNTWTVMLDSGPATPNPGRDEYGGGIRLKNTEAESTVILDNAKRGGRLTLRGQSPAPSGYVADTCRLRGDDATLVLQGAPKPRQGRDPGTADKDPAFSGGEIITRQGVEAPHVDATQHRPDNQVFVQGEVDSKYRPSETHDPRIWLNGPEATIVVGRGRQHEDAEAVNGGLTLRDEEGGELLKASARINTAPPGSNKHTQSEVAFDYAVNGTVESTGGGAIRACREGLMFLDASGDPAMYIQNDGKVYVPDLYFVSTTQDDIPGNIACSGGGN